MDFGIYTIIIVIVTVLVSLAAFRDQQLQDRLILWPYRMDRPNQYYRFLSNGLIHADGQHLFFNMFTLYFIGSGVEQYYEAFINHGFYLLLYVLGIIAASIPSFIKNKNNSYYRSLGASGGVAAVMFALVYFNPWGKILVFFIPMPSIVFAILYLAYSVYASRQNRGYVNHDAHFWGSVFGMVFTFICDPTHGQIFLQQLKNFSF